MSLTSFSVKSTTRKALELARINKVNAEFGIAPFVPPVAKKRGALLDGSGVVAAGGAPLNQCAFATLGGHCGNCDLPVPSSCFVSAPSESLVTLQFPAGRWYAIGLRPGWQYCLGASALHLRAERRAVAA